MYPAGLDTSSMKSKHTDEQLGWLRNHLADYETRASGNVRGDAKKFALEMASKYIEKWGVPEGEKETTVREQIYTWFKNTSARGKEARKRHQLMKKAERPSTAYLTVPNIELPAHPSTSTAQIRYPPPPPQPQLPPAPAPSHYVPIVPPPANPVTPQYNPPPAPPGLSGGAIDVRDSLLNPSHNTNDVSTSMQICANMPDIIHGMFAAAVVLTTTTAAADLGLSDPLYHLLHRYNSGINLWPSRIACKSFVGATAGRHLLQHAIRKNALWVPSTPPLHHHHLGMEEELARLNMDRQRRRDHLLWARIHAAAVEMGLQENSWLAESLANDLMWENDEVEWVCGCVLLRGLIRAGKMPTDSLTMSWNELMHRYQDKWKEVRDEGRQTLMAETLLDIRKLLEGHPRM